MMLMPRTLMLAAMLAASAALVACDSGSDPRLSDPRMRSESQANEPAMATGAGEVAGGALPSPAAETEPVQVTGVVTAIDRTQRRITLEHEPTPALGSVAGTHTFPVADSAHLEDVKEGQHVVFQVAGGSVIAIEEFKPSIEVQQP